MKTNLLYYFFLLHLSFASCSRSPEEKAISVIVHHLEKNLNDPASYIPVDFQILEEFNLQVNNNRDDANDSSSHSFLAISSDTASVPETMARMQGWKILHKFRCRSESGMVKDTQLLFFINKEYKIKKLQ